MWNNETRQFDFEEWAFEGQWFEDEDGFLYIVPTPDVIAECEGPDNTIMDAINLACRENDGVVPREIAEGLKLTEIPHCLRRWNEQDGYYHA